MSEPRPDSQPAQQQEPPGVLGKMDPKPDHGEESYRGSGKLTGKAAVITGGAVVLAIFGLVDASSPSSSARVQRTILRGGAWIGAMERLAMLATILANWPEGILGIVTIKAFARYPELKTGQGSGATERFIIGSFASLGWAAGCAGVVMILL